MMFVVGNVLALLAAASPPQPRGSVYLYCEGSPPPQVRPSFAYVSPVFARRTRETRPERDVVRDATSDFREQVEDNYGHPIGAGCHASDSWDEAERERRDFIRHRRDNGWRLELLP